MKRIILILAAILTLAAPLAVAGGSQVSAASVFGGCTNGKPNASNTNYPDACTDAKNQGTKNNPVINIIKAAINVLSFIIGIGAVIAIVVSGVRMIFSGGDSQAVASARTALIYALAGLAVVALSQALVAFVLDRVQ